MRAHGGVFLIRLMYMVTLMPGLEEVASQEISELGGKIIEIRSGHGRILFEGDIDLIPKLNYLARTIERVLALLTVEKFQTLDDIYKIVKSLDFREWIRPDQSFAIRPLRVGEHDFTSIDVGRVAGQAVIDNYLEAKGVRLKVNLNNPDVIIRVDVIFDTVYVGIDTTGDTALHKRGYRIYQHPAPLNPSIAASLIRLAGWKVDERFLDPMCGSGTILIEAAMMGRNIPPGKFRVTNYAFHKILGEDTLKRVMASVQEKRDLLMELYGVEKFRKHIKGALINADKAGVFDTITVIRGDATRLEELFRDPFDVVVVNPPYGLRIARKGIIRDLYFGFLRSLKNLLHERSRVVIITSEDEVLRSAAMKNKYVIRREMRVKYGDLDTTVFLMGIT